MKMYDVPMPVENYLNCELECSCGKTHHVPIKDVIVSAGALNEVPALVKKYDYKHPYIICDEITYKVAAQRCEELLKALKEKGIHTAVDTCGFVSRETLDKVIPYTDIFLYDLKAFDEETHIRCTGQSNALILENLRYLDSCGKKCEIRIPYVPGYNDDQMEKLAAFVKTLGNVTKVKVLAYHNYAGSKYESLGMENTLPTQLPTKEQVAAAQALFA